MIESTEIYPGCIIGGFVLEEQIGSGSFSTVWRACHLITNKFAAIKVVKKETISNDLIQTRFQREIALLKKMDHPFITAFFQVIEDHDNYFLVMEYAENGTLREFFQSIGRFTELQARRYFVQIISALEYLHSKRKVVHRDLKLENVLLDRYNNIHITDFGLSNTFSDVSPELKSACGSPAYAAPEMIKGEPYTQATDIWSAGILLYAMVAGSLPFFDDDVQKLLAKIVFTDVIYPSHLSTSLVDLLKKMICKNIEERITIAKIKEHPWFSQVEYEVMTEKSMANIFNLGDIHTNLDSGEALFDKEIIDNIASFNINTHDIHNSLLNGEFTPNTALYKLFLREKLTERMRDIMNQYFQPDGVAKLATQPLGKFSGFRDIDQIKPLIITTGRRQSIPMTKAGSPGLNTFRPLPTKIGAFVINMKRNSRPIAIRKTARAPSIEQKGARCNY
ncbi:CAMK family protein kinase [Tritrichomonas foetus]|uniref:non-specific serine/threonine protein kinase n=1 Tax=Tritrichomonas foetus TaxID=1144522 RepID=A0A1J4K2B5_9EUKA|nr:CAMK family protein kinase [Tritrichomonas foetus]|eukprot:OHT05535.1 CAMK family protein kinase [Tritrichomonas foetus]